MWRLLRKLKVELTYNLVTSYLSIDLKGSISYHLQVQGHCGSNHKLENGTSLNACRITNDWIMKMWYTVEYNAVYSVVKKYENIKSVEERGE